jgi:hypothetical protein
MMGREKRGAITPLLKSLRRAILNCLVYIKA